MKKDDHSQNDAAAKQIAQLQKDLEQFRELAARAQADLQNAKMRVEKEAGDMRKFATESIVRRILSTLDNFTRAFQHVPPELNNHEWVKGVFAIEQDLMRQMEEVGLKRMQSTGQIVDPLRHETLSLGPGEEGRVVEVFEEGYELNGKVIRVAKVRAGCGATGKKG